MSNKPLPAPTPEDIRNTADIVLGMRSEDPAEFTAAVSKASAAPAQYLGAALTRVRSPGVLG